MSFSSVGRLCISPFVRDGPVLVLFSSGIEAGHLDLMYLFVVICVLKRVGLARGTGYLNAFGVDAFHRHPSS